MNTLVSVHSLTTAANDHIQALQSFADIMFSASERLFALNIQTARAMFADTPPFDPTKLHAAHQQYATQAYEQAATYFRKLSALNLETQGEFSAFNTERMSEFSRAFCEWCDSLAKGAPKGSDDFLAAFTTILNQTTAAYESFIRTTRDVAAPHFATGGTTLNPINPEAAATPKSARKSA